MMQNIPQKAAGAVISAWLCAVPAAWAGDQAKAIVNSLDPKSMNELFEALPAQPDAALTNIVPVSPNKFRFLFVWPGSNPLMTYDRVGLSFADRFAAFARPAETAGIRVLPALAEHVFRHHDLWRG